MPLILPTPVTFDLTDLPAADAEMADPFTTAPNVRLTQLQTRAYALGLIPENFRGNVAGAILEKNGRTTGLLMFEPWDVQIPDAQLPKGIDLWPGMAAKEVPNMTLTNGLGETKTLRRRLREIFEPFPERDYDKGGKEQEQRRAQWRRVLTDALSDPSLQLVEWVNRHPDMGRITDLTQWWCGESPFWQTRFDKTFYAPRSGVRLWFDWMLQGISHKATEPLLTEETAPNIPVLFEDNAIIVINKPSRICSVPGVRETVSAKQILEKTRGEIFAVHRLDLDTSGILVFAKHKPAAAHLNASFSSRTAKKHYVARLEGKLDAAKGEIDLPLGLNWLDRPRQCVLDDGAGGKPCRTIFENLGTIQTSSGTKTLVKLIPETGRTHQLRLHCALGLGLPIDGDPFYGHMGLAAETNVTRLCLHAQSLTFAHPETGEVMCFEAPSNFPDF